MKMDEKIKSLWEKLIVRYDVPKLVFSVVGDSETFVPKVWPRPIFQSALIEAAKHSGGDTWILFRGEEKSVSSLILGSIDTYTYLQNQHLCVNEKVEANSLPVKAIRLNFGDDVKKEQGTGFIQDSSESIKLREFKDHVECMVLDTADNFNDVRLQFECFIQDQVVEFWKGKEQGSSKKREELNIELPVPVVRVLVEGDINSIDEIVESVKRNISVIIVKGSGKAANIILDYIQRPKSLKSNAALWFGIGVLSESFQKLKEKLKELKRNEHLINVFDVDKNKAGYFLQVTGEAIVRARANYYFQSENKENISEHAGDTCTYISGETKKEKHRGRIVQDEHDKQFDVMPASLPLFFYFGYQVLQEKGKLLDLGYILLFEALKTNKWDYVKVLVSEGVMFKETYLAKLYKETFPLYKKTGWFLKKEEFVKIRIRSDSVLSFTNEPLVEEQTLDKKEKKRQKMEQYKAVSKAVRKMCCYLLHHDDPGDSIKELLSADRSLSRNAIHMDLLLWAIFAQREEIAGYFWLHGENHLVSSLICTVLLKKLSKMSADEKEYHLSKKFENHARLFEKRANMLLDAMYEQDQKSAMATLDETVTVFGVKTTPLTFAYENMMYDVLGHPCSQHRMDLIWHKKVMFLGVLLLYTYFVLVSADYSYLMTYKGLEPVEYTVYLWGLGDFIEEYRPLVGLLTLIPQGKFRRFFFKLKLHLNDVWNVLDILWYISLALTIFVREGFQDTWGKVFLIYFSSGTLLLTYLRFNLALMMIRKFGTTLIMIKEMLKDLLVFLWVTISVTLAVGIYYVVNTISLQQNTNLILDFLELIWKFYRIAYWQNFGESNSDELEYEGAAWPVYVIAGFYMMFTNLLLLNLVVAMFRCECGFCEVMRTSIERICCAEVSLIQRICQNCNLECITQHQTFIDNCLNERVLEVSLHEYIQMEGPLDDNEPMNE